MNREERFVEKYRALPSGCWEWTASKNAAGYGNFSWAGTKRIVASRASYMLFVGEIPEGHEVDHLCRNRWCVNPEHLEAVSLAENRKRRHSPSGRTHYNGAKTHCKRGHPLDGDNLVINSVHGYRECKKCKAATSMRYKERRKV